MVEDTKKPTEEKTEKSAGGVLDKVISKIKEAENVLVAVSNDPTVDELAAAIGLEMVLDGLGKYATAIYSGRTPNVLEFLNPSETFEKNTNGLQDFIIALNKDKADHLRYKVDGDFVKVYITPYKTTISAGDLEFSRGDFNVDLVIALNVPAASELDAALKEHGRIMHDATSVNITNGAEGDFGDVQWVDSKAGSVSEMVTKLAFQLTDDKPSEAAATAFLTGLVATTDRFSNQATTPDVMMLAAKLMGAGADQQLVAANIGGSSGASVQTPVMNMNTEETPEKVEEGAEEIKEEVKEEKSEEAAPEALDLRGESSEAEKVEEIEAVETTEGAETSSGMEISHEEKPEEKSDDGLTLSREQMEVKEEVKEVEPEKPAEVKPEDKSEEKDGTEVGKDVESGVGSGSPAKQALETPSESQQEASEPKVQEEKREEASDPVKDAMMSALNPMGMNNSQGGATSVADQILGKLAGNDKPEEKQEEGPKDYGKLIDEALAEPLPGEGGIQVGEKGPLGMQVDTQDVDDMTVQAGGEQGMTTDPGAMPGMAPADAGMSEQEALDLIKQGQQENAIPGLDPNAEPPKIITGGGMSSLAEESLTSGDNPATSQAPEVSGTPEANNIPDMNFGGGSSEGVTAQGEGVGMMPSMEASPEPTVEPNVETSSASVLPMPGQEMAPPPNLPTPDFGAMPPSDSVVVPNLPEVPGGIGMQTGAGTFQSNEQIASEMNSAEPADPNAFKIPGIHT